MTRGLNEAVLAKASAAENTNLVRAAGDETMEEVAKQWICRDDPTDLSSLSLPNIWFATEEEGGGH